MSRHWHGVLLCPVLMSAALAQPAAETTRLREPSSNVEGARLGLLIVGEHTRPNGFANAWIPKEADQLTSTLVDHGFHVRRLDRSPDARLDDDAARAELQRLMNIARRGDCLLVAFVGYGERVRDRARGLLHLGPDATLRLAELDQAYWDTHADRVLTVVHAFDAHTPSGLAGDTLYTLRPQRGRDWLVAFETAASLDHGRDLEGKIETGSAYWNAFQRALRTRVDRDQDGSFGFRDLALEVSADLRRQAYLYESPLHAETLWHAEDVADVTWKLGLQGSLVRPSAPVPSAQAVAKTPARPGEDDPPSDLRRHRFDARERMRSTLEGRNALAAVQRGIVWLRRTQEENGRWNDGLADATLYDVGLTGLSLLAFQGHGHVHTGKNPISASMRRGIDWLLGQQVTEGEYEGLFGTRASHSFIYNHALAALAIVEAYHLTRDEGLRTPAQRAVNFVLSARNPYKAWRYAVPPNGENDASVTGFMVNLLTMAGQAGLTTDDTWHHGAMALFDELTDAETGRCGYVARGEFPARPVQGVDTHPPEVSESLTAVALFSRVLLGMPPLTSPVCQAHADLILQKLPRWSEDGSTNDLYYWYYGSQALFQMDSTRAAKWQRAVREALVPHQILGQPLRPGELDAIKEAAPELGHEGPFGPPPTPGHWDAKGPWSSTGGNVYSTAMALLALEAPMRYPRFDRTPR